MILALVLLASSPALSVPLQDHGWQLVGSQAAQNRPDVRMRYWLAPLSVQPVEANGVTHRAAVAVETIGVDGTQVDVQIAGHLIDCAARTWQVEWAAFPFDDKALVSYPKMEQRGQPKNPAPGGGMDAVLGRVCARNEN